MCSLCTVTQPEEVPAFSKTQKKNGFRSILQAAILRDIIFAFSVSVTVL